MIEINEDKLKSNYDEVKSYLNIYYKLGQPLIDDYAKELDDKLDKITSYMSKVRELNLEFDIPSLEKIVMELSTTLYYTSSRLEQVNLLANMSKIRYKDKYNECFTNLQGAAKQEDRKYTNDQLRAMSEQESIEEELVSFIYDHVCDVLKAKIDSGYEVLKSISKSLSAQIESMKQFGYSQKG